MLAVGKIANYDRRIDILEYTNDDSGAERVRSLTNKYASVPAVELKSSGSERTDEYQIVAVDRRAFKIRKMDRQIDTQMVVSFDGSDYGITSVHSFGQDRAHIVLECEYLDNAR